MNEAFPVQWDDPPDPDLSWERDDMHHPSALTPLAGDYILLGIVAGFNYRYERANLPLHAQGRILNGYVYFAYRLGVAESERPQVLEQAVAARRAQAKVVRKYWDEKAFPTLLSTYRWMEVAPIESAPLTMVAALWDEAWTRIAHLWGLHFMTNAGSYQSLNDLADIYESVVPGARSSEAFTLVHGFATELQRVAHDLYHLAECAQALPAVARALVDDDPQHVLAALPHLEGGREFAEAFQTFLAAHGHLGQPFDDLRLPSWDDHPALVLAELRKRLQDPREDPDVRRGRLIAAADALADQVRARLADLPDDLHRFKAALALAREAGPLTEDHNYWLDRMLHSRARRFMLRVGTRLTTAGILAEPDDVFFLHTDEVRKALSEGHDSHKVVGDRRREYAHQSTLKPPKYLGKAPDPSGPPNRFDVGDQPQPDPTKLRGVGASPGTARGTARVVLAPEDFGRVEAGDVLVCPSSNPSWVPLFGIIAGLVTNTGGVTSHAAVVAREFAVPAVVGTGEATQRIRDGQQVEVDGTAGEVRLL